ncbi:MAG TPA: aminotransferase class I/II-fold pyridoxal phosphate-dependent enzyme [Chromatiales bacterium]|nr:aminotransferase class I/II-fold pyridoxal phosphate-dependent enzyme [Chromatiales bacterium]
MSQMATDHGALNLSQGFPDFPAPQALLDRVCHHLAAGHNQYAPMAGLDVLRERIAQKTLRLYGHDADPEQEVTVTSGATEALFCAIEAFVHDNDEVIVFDPAYDSYDPAIRLAGGMPVHLPLTRPEFTIDFDRLSDAIGPRTRMIVLNTPHNPTGAVIDADAMARLADLLRNTPILLLSDEVYEHIIFDGRQHESLLRNPELASRALVVSSFGKTYHATGWKIAYVVAPSALTLEFRRIHQFVQFCGSTPMQYALADFLESNPQHDLNLPAFYQRKRDLFCKLLAGSRFRFRPSAGTYFQLLDYSAITDEPDVEYAQRLTREAGIASIPVSVFQKRPPADQRLLRFCFAKHDSTLKQAAEILCRL